jgi:hypothetical protein
VDYCTSYQYNNVCWISRRSRQLHWKVFLGNFYRDNLLLPLEIRNGSKKYPVLQDVILWAPAWRNLLFPCSSPEGTDTLSDCSARGQASLTKNRLLAEASSDIAQKWRSMKETCWRI